MLSAPDDAARGGSPLPVALAAVTVAGQCRERSPADLAIFGAGADRFVDRFADRAAGQGLLARAIRDGVVEAEAELLSAAGPARFRVSLWRQRGGERVRLVAAFAADRAAGDASSDGATVPAAGFAGRHDRERLAQLAHGLRRPLAAIIDFAELLRRETPCAAGARAHGSDILSACWRMLRLVEDLNACSAGRAPPPAEPRPGEVDPARLARRILRLHRPRLEALGVDLRDGSLAASAVAVLADESVLWSAVEAALDLAIRNAGAGGRLEVAARADEPGDGFVLRLEGSPPAQPRAVGVAQRTPTAADEGVLEQSARQLGIGGGALEVGTGPGGAFVVRIAFPAALCLPTP